MPVRTETAVTMWRGPLSPAAIFSRMDTPKSNAKWEWSEASATKLGWDWAGWVGMSGMRRGSVGWMRQKREVRGKTKLGTHLI